MSRLKKIVNFVKVEDPVFAIGVLLLFLLLYCYYLPLIYLSKPNNILENKGGVLKGVIAVDFDGTCVSHAYPKVGVSIGAESVLRELVDEGYSLVLWTVRSGKEMADAIRWFFDNDIPLYGVNDNKQQASWSSSRKVHADLYIDDLALGAPVKMTHFCDRPVVDWAKMRVHLVLRGFLAK